MSQDTNLWIDALYFHYIEYKGADGEEVQECYDKLYQFLNELPQRKRNEIECAVSAVCAVTERIAFEDGVRIGGKLMLELTK